MLALTNYASSGRFLQILRASAAGGGSRNFAFSGPLRLIEEVTTNPADTFLLSLSIAAVALAFSRIPTARIYATQLPPSVIPPTPAPTPFWRTLPVIFFVATLLVTIVIFGSPGTFGNHFVELEAAIAILLAVTISRHPGWQQFGALALAGMMLLMTVRYGQDYHDEDTEPFRDHYAAIEAAVRSTGKPALSENPIIAIDSGERPYILDPFMLRVLATRDPEFTQPLWYKLDQRAFGAVVLEFDPRIDEGKFVYQNIHFGAPFLEHLTANYEFAEHVGDLFVWKPKDAEFPAIESDEQ